nr:valine--tRNA ligase [Candidatus Saccharicenans sp.]
PLQNRLIPVITDEQVQKDFGTGAVKVTPAHDPVDFELGKKHGLEQIIVIDGNGRMTEAAGEEFKGLDRFACREKVIEKLKQLGYLVKVEDYSHAVGHCYRCKTIIEPHLSWQWFVRIEPLAKEAIKAVEDGKIVFIPENWAKTYFDWMYKIHDWCISRQLWWGHRLPAYYCQNCHQVMVAMEKPAACEKCGGPVVQDEDVLDTWFSSALWPFATLGWPEKTEDLKVFYPTDLMSTGFDIIFFWVARMIMMGLKFMKDVPFREVFINGLVRDLKKRKMSKSEGNIIDPLEMIDKYGTDALRFTLASLAVPGMDIALSEERMAGYRAFANKIWNASRFVLMNLGEEKLEPDQQALSLPNRWIRSRLTRVIEQLNDSLKNYKFYEAAETIYHFIWHEFCDWYIEFIKPELKESNKNTQAVMEDTLDKILKLLHPFMPFITEEIWHHLPESGLSLLTESWPEANRRWLDEEAEETMRFLQALISEIRTIRAENQLPVKEKVNLWISEGKKSYSLSGPPEEAIRQLAGVDKIEYVTEMPTANNLLRGVAGTTEIGLQLARAIDSAQEIERLQKELARLEEDLAKLVFRLENPDFKQRAPQAVVAEHQQRRQELQLKREKLLKSLSQLKES